MSWRCAIPSLQKRVLRSGASGISVRMLTIVASFLSSVVIVRLLGPEEYGRFAFVLTIVTLFAIPGTLGLPNLMTREIASAEAVGNWGKMRGIMQWTGKIVLISSLLICFAVLLLIWSDLISINESSLPVLVAGLFLVPLLSFAETISVLLRAMHKVFWGLFPNQVMRPLLMMVGVLALGFFTHRSVTAFEVIISLGVVLLFVIALETYLARRYLPKEVMTARADYDSYGWWRALLPLSVSSGLTAIYTNSDLLMIGFILNEVDVGAYRIALSIANLGAFAFTAMALITQPYYAKAYQQGDMESINSVSRIAGAVSFMCTSGFLIVLLVVGERMFSFVYGTEHVNSYLPTLILCIGRTVFSFWGPLSALFIMAHQEKTMMRVQLVLVSINIIANLILIPKFGINGAAVATAVTYCLQGIVLACLKSRIALPTSR